MEPITLDDIPVLIMVVDKNHIITFSNSYSMDVFGYEPDELVGQNIDVLVPDSFKPDHHKQVESFYQKPVTRPLGIGRDLFGRCKNGALKQVEVSLSLITVKNQSCVLTVVIDVNIRKLKEDLDMVSKVMRMTSQTLDLLDCDSDTTCNIIT